MTDAELDAVSLTDVDLFLAKVYNLFFTTPILSAFREGDEDEDCAEMVVAVKADRFHLMTKVRELRQEALQQRLPLARPSEGLEAGE